MIWYTVLEIKYIKIVMKNMIEKFLPWKILFRMDLFPWIHIKYNIRQMFWRLYYYSSEEFYSFISINSMGYDIIENLLHGRRPLP